MFPLKLFFKGQRFIFKEWELRTD